MSIEPPFEEYSKTLKNFYLKVTKKHTNMLKLSRNLIQMIDDLSKSHNVLGISRISRKKSELSLSGASSPAYAKSVKSIRSLSNLKHFKSDLIYQNPSLKKIILFGYLFHIITISNGQIFNIIQTKSKLLIDAVQQSKIQDKMKWDTCVKQWKKIMQLLSHKTRVRWQKILANSITSMDENFVDILLKSIMNYSASLQNLFVNVTEHLQQLSNLLKITICYFEMNKGSMVKKIKSGDYRHQLRLAYIQNSKNYAFYEKTPPQKQESVNQQATEKNVEDKNLLSVDAKSIKRDPGLSKSTSHSKVAFENSSQNSHDSKKQSNGKSKEKSVKSGSQASKRKPGLPSNLIKKKSLRVIQALLRQYNSNTVKLTDLECFEVSQNKDTRIKKLLQSRKKQESE